MDREKQFRKRRLIHPIKYNSLSIVLFALFVICMSAQSVVGWRLQNETLAAHGQALIGHWHNLSTGTFLEGLASVLYQRGAPHSRDPRKAKNAQNRREEADRFTWLYRNSLFRAFVLLFVFSLTLHIAFGTNAYNEERALIGQPPISVAAFLLSAKFWSSTLQTWQAEYLAIALFVVLSIFLRQQDSAESQYASTESRSRAEREPGRRDSVSDAGPSPGRLVGEGRGREGHARCHWTVAGTVDGFGRHDPAFTERLNTVRNEM